MEEGCGLYTPPCVVWGTRVPVIGTLCKSPDIFLQGSKWQLSLFVDPGPYLRNMYKIYLKRISENAKLEHTFKVTTFILGPRSISTQQLCDIRMAECASIEIWKASSDNILQFTETFQQCRKLKIVCLFQVVTNRASSKQIKYAPYQINLINFESSGSSPHQIQSKLSSNKSAQMCVGVPDHLASLSVDLSNLLKNETFSDIRMKCQEHNLPAHRAVLAARSEVFAAMFRSKMSESQDGTVDIVDTDSAVFDLFLKYLYSGRIEKLSEDTARGLYVAADKYAVQSLKKACCIWLIERLTGENCLNILVLADAHNDQNFKQGVVNFAADHLKEVKKETWSRFSKEYPSLSNTVYQKVLEAVLSEQE